MHRIDTPTAQKDKFGAGKNGFTRGNPQTGTPATDLDDDYFDMLQEELAGVVEATGVNLEKSKHNQLLTALKALLLSRANPFADIKADGAAAVSTALSNLGLVIGSDPGNLVTSGSTQPVYKSLLYAQDAKTITQRGYLANGVIGADTLIKLGAVLAKNNTKNWTLETFIAAYCGNSQDAIDSGIAIGTTDGGNFTYLWKLLNNGSLIGPGGRMASESWANALFLSKTDVKEIGYMQSDQNRPYFKDKDGLFRELQLKNSADLSSTGWRRDTSTGELIQWGIASNVQDDTPAQVAFPIAFPNYCLSFKTSLKRKSRTTNTTSQLSVWGDYNDLGSGTVVFQSNSQDADTRSGDIYWEARGY
jgi:hypothetical protein